MHLNANLIKEVVLQELVGLIVSMVLTQGLPEFHPGSYNF